MTEARKDEIRERVIEVVNSLRPGRGWRSCVFNNAKTYEERRYIEGLLTDLAVVTVVKLSREYGCVESLEINCVFR